MLRWGKPQYVRLLEKRAREGRPTPALDSRPVLLPHLHLVWQAFNDLHKRRQSGFGPSPIPTSEVLAWLDLFEVDDQEEREDFYFLIGVMDDEWLAWARTERENSRKDRKRAGSSSSNRRQQGQDGG